MAKDVCQIYVITNSINSKVYIGQTWGSLNRRLWRHANEEGCPKIHRAIKKYSRENFEITPILSTNNQEDADFCEILLIEEFDCIKNGYNLKLGGDGGKHCEETRIKMGNSHRGKKRSAQACVNIAAGKMGVKNPSCKLTEQQAREIKILSLIYKKSATSIGKYYGIVRETIRDIADNTNWNWLTLTENDTLDPDLVAQF